MRRAAGRNCDGGTPRPIDAEFLLQSPTRVSAPPSEAEPQSDRASDIVALEKAVGQSAIHLREHYPGIEIPL
jgi:hypothetical protein